MQTLLSSPEGLKLAWSVFSIRRLEGDSFRRSLYSARFAARFATKRSINLKPLTIGTTREASVWLTFRNAALQSPEEAESIEPKYLREALQAALEVDDILEEKDELEALTRARIRADGSTFPRREPRPTFNLPE